MAMPLQQPLGTPLERKMMGLSLVLLMVLLMVLMGLAMPVAPVGLELPRIRMPAMAMALIALLVPAPDSMVSAMRLLVSLLLA